MFFPGSFAIAASWFLDFKAYPFPGLFRRRHELPDGLENNLDFLVMIFQPCLNLPEFPCELGLG